MIKIRIIIRFILITVSIVIITTNLNIFKAKAGDIEGYKSDICNGIKESSVKICYKNISGSGTIIGSEGYIITNHHVISEMFEPECTVQLNNSDEIHSFKVIFSSEERDIALIKVNKKFDNNQVVKLGNSNLLKVGTNVFAVGSPIGVDSVNIVTEGIISNCNVKEIILDTGKVRKNVILSDASTRWGNSGGGLFNIKGELIAVNSASDKKIDGINLSVPINDVKELLKQHNVQI